MEGIEAEAALMRSGMSEIQQTSPQQNTYGAQDNMDNTSEDFEELDAAVLAESRKSPAQTVLICPQCGSKN